MNSQSQALQDLAVTCYAAKDPESRIVVKILEHIAAKNLEELIICLEQIKE